MEFVKLRKSITKIEIIPKSKRITLQIQRTGTDFLNKLLETIDKMEIDPKLFTQNKIEYYKLLPSLYN
ncbi:MAG: hypothetical protein O4861_08255 [Trichodesmium sp. St16_bin4-tuft]|uniref:hypothetical protein n=1 Tax=Trichodesmium erythraeum TaxID=1206 RepID=UPI00003C9F40|nr:hypothetical protein [Trichodesmium sp. St4_bin8_1]MDE5077985.1 hypothetical protein [Trichodesmium sp. St2_bin6]MDE5098328.1 hypothetical protein [Trichodesmium sp. St16_bin4-tuft]MDE5101442.1 hypothetical protein [Trichodesmium sp. St19_bin2]